MSGSRQSKDSDVQLPCSSAWRSSSGISQDLRQVLSAGMLCSSLQKYSRCDERNKWKCLWIIAELRFSEILIFKMSKKIRRKKSLWIFLVLISVSGENLSPYEEEKCPCKAVSQLTWSRFQTHLLNDCALSLTGAKEEGKREREEESAGERKHEAGCLAWLGSDHSCYTHVLGF